MVLVGRAVIHWKWILLACESPPLDSEILGAGSHCLGGLKSAMIRVLTSQKLADATNWCSPFFIWALSICPHATVGMDRWSEGCSTRNCQHGKDFKKSSACPGAMLQQVAPESCSGRGRDTSAASPARAHSNDSQQPREGDSVLLVLRQGPSHSASWLSLTKAGQTFPPPSGVLPGLKLTYCDFASSSKAHCVPPTTSPVCILTFTL